MMAKYLIGVDEVGRGALAGPILVGAVAMPVGFNFRKMRVPLRDSKKLTEKQREEWFSFLKKEPKIFFKTARVNSRVIDRINISKAGNLAVNRAMRILIKKVGEKNIERVMLDKGLCLKIPNNKLQMTNNKGGSYKKDLLKIKTEVKADEKFKEVALASIIAKVIRDRYMKKLHKKFPNYGFLNHVGYGTKEHKEKIRLCGILNIHRKSFCGFLERS